MRAATGTMERRTVRAVNCNNYPWNVNTNIGVRGACDLDRGIKGAVPYGALARIIKGYTFSL